MTLSTSTDSRKRAKPKHDQAKREHDALVALLEALGELPSGTLDQRSYKAYCAAVNVIDPDDFTERFMASVKRT